VKFICLNVAVLDANQPAKKQDRFAQKFPPDSTVATDVERLLGTIKPLLMATASPYRVEYVPGCRNQPGAAAPAE
jgi:hypothetical protein